MPQMPPMPPMPPMPQRLNTPDPDPDPNPNQVVKARLNSNPAIEDWLLGEGLKVSKLPTLVLIKGGVPLRALAGKLPILDEASLQGFALDGGFVPHSAVVPTRGVVKHAHDGTVVPTANPNPKPDPSADAVGRVRVRVRPDP